MNPASTAAVMPAPSLRLWVLLRSISTRLAGDAMFRKSVLSIADQAVVSATSFAITVVLGRLCGKPEVGLYYLALQVVFFARGVQEQVIASPYLVYNARKRGNEAARYAGSSLLHELTLLAVVAGSLASIAAWRNLSPELTELFWLLAAAAPLLLLREFIRQIAFAQLRVTEALAVDCGVAILQLGAVAAAAYAGVLSTPLTYTLMAIGCGIAVVAWLVRRGGTFAAAPQAAWSDWLHNWKFGRWALASQLLGQTMPLAFPWIVAGTHGEAAAGSLGVGTTLIGFANMYVLGLSNFICPRAAQAYAGGGTRELTSVLKHAVAMHLAVLVPFALAMFVAGPTLMAWIYGPDFADAGTLMAILAVGAIANSLGIVAGNGLWAMELPSANFKADACAMVTWLVSTVVLVPSHGALGAAIASITGTAVGAVVRGSVLLGRLREKS
jgi:O-antigen/teichoic acid export membrane protein